LEKSQYLWETGLFCVQTNIAEVCRSLKPDWTFIAPAKPEVVLAEVELSGVKLYPFPNCYACFNDHIFLLIL